MNLDFDLDNVRSVEFGIGRDDEDVQSFVRIPVDSGVQDALKDMAQVTWGKMEHQDNNPPRYEPSEKHGGEEYIYLPLNDELAKRMRQLHEAQNLPSDSGALKDASGIFCYFARMTDVQGKRLTVLRRATQFKGILKSRLIRLVTDALRIVEDRLFKLDSDFDLLIDSDNVHILRPSAFEFAGRLQDALLAAVPQNINAVQRDIPFVDFSSIETYAAKHPRAARYLASIRSLKETKSIDRQALKRCCADAGIEIKTIKGKLVVQDGQEIDFLEVLDRRRYTLELVKGLPERFKAASRQKLDA